MSWDLSPELSLSVVFPAVFLSGIPLFGPLSRQLGFCYPALLHTFHDYACIWGQVVGDTEKKSRGECLHFLGNHSSSNQRQSFSLRILGACRLPLPILSPWNYPGAGTRENRRKKKTEDFPPLFQSALQSEKGGLSWSFLCVPRGPLPGLHALGFQEGRNGNLTALSVIL